jgi:1-deoxyxylulose-5-phosphate synthase
MEALHEVLAAGKVRYLGASSMWAWQFAKMQHTAAQHGRTRFVSMQNQYSLVQRKDEREMLPLLADQGVVSLPWCPLGKGYLTRPYGRVTSRSANDPIGQRFFHDVDRPIVDAVQRIAASREVPMAQVALAWSSTTPPSPHPSSERPTRPTLMTPWPPWRCSSTKLRSTIWKARTHPVNPPASENRPLPGATVRQHTFNAQ